MPHSMRALAEKSVVQTREHYWNKQVGELAAQAGEIRTLSTKLTADVAAPIRVQAAQGLDKAT